MKKNYFIKNPKRDFLALVLLFCGLFANTANAQRNIGWTGATDNSWAIASNWNYSGITSVGTYTFNATTPVFLITLAVANAEIAVGDKVAGFGIQAGTTVTAIDGTQKIITIDKSTLAAGTATNVTFTFASPKAGTGIPAATEIASISNGGNPTIAPGSYSFAGIIVSNQKGPETGSTLTLGAGVTLNITSATADAVVLRGGNIVNNGTLNITGTLTTGANNAAAFGMSCGTPVVIPSSPTEFVYSGSGALNINTSAGNNFSGGIICYGLDATAANTTKATYKFLFNGTSNFMLSAVKTTAATPTSAVAAIKVAGGAAPFAFPVIIGGNGFTLGSAVAGVPYGILNQGGAGTKVTVNAETTLTAYSGNGTGTGNGSHILSFYGYANNATADGYSYFTNKGTINMSGTTTRSGISISTEWDAITNFDNQGTINANISSFGSNQGAFLVPISGTTKSPNASKVNFTNSGTLSLSSPLNGAGAGFAMLITGGGQTPSFDMVNSGTLNLTGANFNTGGRAYNPTTLIGSSIINSGTLTTNQELRAFNTTNTGTITFTNTGAAEPLKLASFTVLATATATAGATYTDANSNIHTIVLTKTATGTSLSTHVAFGANVPGLGDLTKTSGSGDATINYSALAIVNKNALNSFTSNSGMINTATGPSHLNVVSGVSQEATGVLSPGGDTGKAIAIFSTALDPTILAGTIKLQISGNTAAGVDYDQLKNTGQFAGFDVSAATLDLTGIYTPAVVTTIDIMTTSDLTGFEGGVIGEFASVVGLTPGWSVNYVAPGVSAGGKVQLAFNPALGSAEFANFKFSVYPNPAISVLNLTAAKNISKVELYNLLGQRVQSHSVEETQKQLDISNLQSGLYLMEVTIDNVKEAYKIIKQ